MSLLSNAGEGLLDSLARCVHVRLPNGVSQDTVQDPHLIVAGEAGQVGAQSQTEALGLLPGALPAQPFLVKRLPRQNNNLLQLLKTD